MYIILVAKAGMLLTGGGCVWFVWWLIAHQFYKKKYILHKVRKAKPISQGGGGAQTVSQEGGGIVVEVDGRSQPYIFLIFNVLLW